MTRVKLDVAGTASLEGEMIRKTLVAAVAVSAWAFAGSAAQATTYVGNESFGSATISLSFTTDGATGALASSDITAWNIDITDGSGSVDLTNFNSGMLLLGGLTATSTGLFFDFDPDGNQFAIQFGGIGTGNAFWCAQSNNAACFDLTGVAGIGENSQFGGIPLNKDLLTGDVEIAAVGTPEPAVWALMLAGFAGLGAVLRSRRSGRALA
jgi:hypothetical protein